MTAVREASQAPAGRGKPVVGSGGRSPLAAAGFHTFVLLPVVLLLVVFAAYAIWTLVSLSLYEVNTLNIDEQTFVGTENYGEVLADERTQRAISNSLVWISISVIASVAIAVPVGMLLSHEGRLSRIVRASILLPWVIPGVVTAMTWKWMFNSQTGIIADLMTRFGVEPFPFLGRPESALLVAIAVNVWRLVPVFALVIAAGVSSIDPALRDASALDGATTRQHARWITLPLIRPYIATVALLAAIWSADSIVFVNVMTGGGPAGASTVLPLRIYQLAFDSFDLGASAVISLLNLGLLIVVGVLYLTRVSRRELKDDHA